MRNLLIQAATAGAIGSIVIYAVAALGALAHYRTTAAAEGGIVSLRGFGRHVFPRRITHSRWTWIDLAIYVLDKLMFVLAVPSGATLVILAAAAMRRLLTDWGLPFPAVPQNVATTLGFLACSLLLRDFIAFYLHYLQHRVPVLWEFHKVHHAPETLIPPTGHRLHPLEQLVNIVIESVMLGLLAGTYAWMTGQDQTELLLCSLGLYLIVNVITFAPLRHSHIGLRLGRLERVLLSPAHHHLHHSVEEPHWDKNFGTIFPLWDWLWNTLATPPAAKYRLGLPGRQSEDYASVPKYLFMPFAKLPGLHRTRGILGSLRMTPRPKGDPARRDSTGRDRPSGVEQGVADGSQVDRRKPDPRPVHPAIVARRDTRIDMLRR
jgi:sterol desaturase/sphingolipid hydroxylase (fatty acid hydroxylase superfamily)